MSLKVIIEVEVKNCHECPYFQYGGESFGEDFCECGADEDITLDCDGEGIPNDCPFIKKTLEKLQYENN